MVFNVCIHNEHIHDVNGYNATARAKKWVNFKRLMKYSNSALQKVTSICALAPPLYPASINLGHGRQ